MKIDVFFDAFPHVAKPNMEAQLLEWQRQGHDLRVFSLGAVGKSASSFPVTFLYTLRQHPLALSLRILWNWVTRPVRSWRILRGAHDLTTAAKHLALDAQLPSNLPEVNFIHNLAAAVPLSYLKTAVPTVKHAVYYHGGELPGVRQIPPTAAAQALLRADIVFSNTQSSVDEVVARGSIRERTFCAPTSFYTERFQPPECRPHLPGGQWRFVCLGRMSPEKGFDVALRAIAALRRRTTAFELTVIGDGPELANLQALVGRLRLHCAVHFTGHVQMPKLIPQLAMFDALILSSVPITGSNWRETQATVMQEAMLMGTVVVASDIGGVRESLPPSLHRYLYPPGSDGDLCSRLQNLMLLDADALRSLSEIARQFVIDNYDIRTVNAQLLKRLSLRSK